ncbi:MAG: mechanosensitive ion channel domain-containing protein, partial [Elusimicrobiota bacterium]
MKIRAIIAVALCAALPSSGAAQTRIIVGAVNGIPGMSVVPQFGGMSAPMSPSLGGTLSAPLSFNVPSVIPTPSLSVAAAPAVVSALSIPILPAAAIPSLVPAAAAKSVAPLMSAGMKSVAQPHNESPSVAVPAASIRADGEAFWSGSSAKEALDDSAPVVVPAAKSPSFLTRGAVALAPAAALPALPAWASAAMPYAEGAAVLGVAYGLTRLSRWVITKLSARFGWEKNTVVLARFISNVVVWTSGVGVGLSVLGVSGTALLATFGAGGTAMALAVTLAVRDVAGNLFHGVHFLLSRPFTVGDKVTIGKTTGVVHDLTLRYLVLKDENGGFILYTYS